MHSAQIKNGEAKREQEQEEYKEKRLNVSVQEYKMELKEHNGNSQPIFDDIDKNMRKIKMKYL